MYINEVFDQTIAVDNLFYAGDHQVFFFHKFSVSNIFFFLFSFLSKVRKTFGLRSLKKEKNIC